MLAGCFGFCAREDDARQRLSFAIQRRCRASAGDQSGCLPGAWRKSGAAGIRDRPKDIESHRSQLGDQKRSDQVTMGAHADGRQAFLENPLLDVTRILDIDMPELHRTVWELRQDPIKSQLIDIAAQRPRSRLDRIIRSQIVMTPD